MLVSNNNSGDYCGQQLSVQWLHLDTTAFHILGLRLLQDKGGVSVSYDGENGRFYLTEYAMKAMNLPADAAEFTTGGQTIPLSGTVADFRRGNILRQEQPFVILLTDRSLLYPYTKRSTEAYI